MFAGTRLSINIAPLRGWGRLRMCCPWSCSPLSPRPSTSSEHFRPNPSIAFSLPALQRARSHEVNPCSIQRSKFKVRSSNSRFEVPRPSPAVPRPVVRCLPGQQPSTPQLAFPSAASQSEPKRAIASQSDPKNEATPSDHSCLLSPVSYLPSPVSSLLSSFFGVRSAQQCAKVRKSAAKCG